MITVEAFLLNGHSPSANIARVLSLYLGGCPGVIVNKTYVKSGPELKTLLYRKKVHNLPAIEVPGEMVRGKRKPLMIADQQQIEDWCKTIVRELDTANRRKR